MVLNSGQLVHGFKGTAVRGTRFREYWVHGCEGTGVPSFPLPLLLLVLPFVYGLIIIGRWYNQRMYHAKTQRSYRMPHLVITSLPSSNRQSGHCCTENFFMLVGECDQWHKGCPLCHCSDVMADSDSRCLSQSETWSQLTWVLSLGWVRLRVRGPTHLMNNAPGLQFWMHEGTSLPLSHQPTKITTGYRLTTLLITLLQQHDRCKLWSLIRFHRVL